MKHLLILFLLLTTNAFAQGPFGDYAVVKDKDGYVNIRAKESVKSKIVGTLPANTLVNVYFWEDEPTPPNWIAVDKGYVHKSRLKMIGEFPSIGKGKEKETENSITIAEKGISVTISTQKFDKTKHKITKKKHKYYEELIIDGKRAQGADFIPENHYKSIVVNINVKMFLSPKVPTMICTKYGYIRIIIRYIMIRKTISFISLHTMVLVPMLTKYAGK